MLSHSLTYISACLHICMSVCVYVCVAYLCPLGIDILDCQVNCHFVVTFCCCCRWLVPIAAAPKRSAIKRNCCDKHNTNGSNIYNNNNKRVLSDFACFYEFAVASLCKLICFVCSFRQFSVSF